MNVKTLFKTLYFAKRFNNFDEIAFWDTLDIAGITIKEKEIDRFTKKEKEIARYTQLDIVELRENSELDEILLDLDYAERKFVLVRPAIFCYNKAYHQAIFFQNAFQDFRQDPLTLPCPILAVLHKKYFSKKPSEQEIKKFNLSGHLANYTMNPVELDEMFNIFINLDKTFDVLDKKGFKRDEIYRNDFNRLRDTNLAVFEMLPNFKLGEENSLKEQKINNIKKELKLYSTKISYFTPQ